jgi:diacylglycerol kinase (ATP)
MPPPTTRLRLSRRALRRQRVRGGTVQIVATPGSGQGRALATARRLARLLERRGYLVAVRSFADLTALTRWAEQCPPHASHVVCIGGDATLSAAAVAAIRRRVPFVPVPNGFGNLFAQVFGYSRRPSAIVYLLDEGEVCYVDVGVVKQGHDEIFLSHRSYGFLEQVQQVAERGRKLPRRYLFRYLWYYGVANGLLLRTRLAPFRVEIDGALVADDAALVTVANVETYRGFLTLTPAASPLDGHFDIFLVPRGSRIGLMSRLIRLLLHLPGRWRGVRLYRGRRVTVTTPQRREELVVRPSVLPLLVRPGVLEAWPRRQPDVRAGILQRKTRWMRASGTSTMR